uniref:Uncharacterized protein n=1 Tax=Magallana gigas TaxID=29159 RepID=A0A8W8JFV1_MAGGI
MKSSALVMKVVQFIFLCIDTLHANVCRSTGGIVECCPGYSWNKIENRCIGCRSGTFGLRCDMSCPYPQYGYNCSSKCSCTEDHCDPADGCPDLTYKSTTFPQSTNIFISSVKMKNGCRSGTFGLRCDMSCPYPQYGYNCSSKCSCTEDHCDPADGCPDLTYKSTTFPQSTNIFISSVKMKNACNDGYVGENCTATCPELYYGRECRLKCNCNKDQCNHIAGCSKSAISEGTLNNVTSPSNKSRVLTIKSSSTVIGITSTNISTEFNLCTGEKTKALGYSSLIHDMYYAVY